MEPLHPGTELDFFDQVFLAPETPRPTGLPATDPEQFQAVSAVIRLTEGNTHHRWITPAMTAWASSPRLGRGRHRAATAARSCRAAQPMHVLLAGRAESLAAFGRCVRKPTQAPARTPDSQETTAARRTELPHGASSRPSRWSALAYRRRALLTRVSLVCFGLGLGFLLAVTLPVMAGDGREKGDPRSMERLEQKMERMYKALEGYLDRDEARELGR